MKWLVLLVSSLVLTGCALPHKSTSEKHAMAAMLAMKNENWDAARRAFARAVVHAELARLSPQIRAVLTYEYGRMLGITCFFDLAESELKRAHNLDRQAGNSLRFTLSELARLNFDQQKFPAATGYFEHALAVMAQEELPAHAPMAYADFLEEYAVALTEISRNAEAAAIKQKILSIRRTNPQGESSTDRTPYGKFCTHPKN